jgi:glycosyltransferase involved in cell wall biosynthesis
MKLIIQIPCFNESKTLAITLKDLPKKVKGFKKVEWLVIDDGSSDNTSYVAKKNGVDHVIRFTRNLGLAKAYMAGINRSLELGADVIVNTDADNQYNAKNIPDLVAPILQKKADLVIGARPINTIEHFSIIKKMLQNFGSWVVRIISKVDVLDAPSGFRAISRDAALRMNVYNNYTYTLETLIEAGQKGLKVVSVPIQVNGELRPSRLIKSIPSYIKNSIVTIVRIFVLYKPFRFFVSLGLLPLVAGIIISIRFIILNYFNGENGHIQSLIFAAILMVFGFILFAIAFIGDLLSVNRKLLEDIQYRARKMK